MDRCSKTRKCGWQGTDEEKTPKINAKLSKEMGVIVRDLCCPKCGCNTFYPSPKPPA